MMKYSKRYHYCSELEHALKELFGQGSKWDGMAGAFEDVKIVRKALLDAITKIRKHLDNILTADDRLRLTTAIILDNLQNEVKTLRDESQNELEIIAHLLSLTIYLLGFDWYKGKPNRQVIYYQTAEQEAFDDAQRHPNDSYPPGKIEFEKRLEIALMLHNQGLRVAQIARILRLSEPLVKDLLVRGGLIQRKDLTKKTN